MRFRVWGNGNPTAHNWRRDYLDSSGNGATPNQAGNGRDWKQAFIPQGKIENDQHLQALQAEWLAKHTMPKRLMSANPAMQKAWQDQANMKAMAWAQKMEPKRYLNPLLRGTNGIRADQSQRRNEQGETAIPSSSWVGDVTMGMNPNRIWVDLGGKKYQYGLTSKRGLSKFMTSDSLGRTIAKLSHMPAGSCLNGLRKLKWGK